MKWLSTCDARVLSAMLQAAIEAMRRHISVASAAAPDVDLSASVKLHLQPLNACAKFY